MSTTESAGSGPAESRFCNGKFRILELRGGDTVNLAALDPVHLIQARKRLGVPFSHLLERRVVRIPVQRIADQPAVVYDGRSHWLNISLAEQPARRERPFDAARGRVHSL
ncbi:MAG: hypothetical protein M3N95_12455 [Actinomycetota bacterium]|nr:hypothetical protein [Actinomycetota bacterium]